MTVDDKLPILGSTQTLASAASPNPAEPNPVETKVYKRRWWVLGVFVLTSCTQVKFKPINPEFLK